MKVVLVLLDFGELMVEREEREREVFYIGEGLVCYLVLWDGV